MKTVDEIYQEMLTCYGEYTGMKPDGGCDLAARLYALAAQVYALQVQADWVARQSFPQTAEGESLDRHAQMRGLERKQAAAARGVIRFRAETATNADRTIPMGTVCMTAGLVRFETVLEGVIPAGRLTADVPARALVPGVSGNAAAGTILSMAVAPAGVESCTNPEAFTDGSDREDDEQLRARVLDTFRRLPNGANAAYYEQAAMAFDEVAAATVVARPRGVGTVDVVVATQGGLPDQGLLEELTDYFEHRREIAVDLQVRAPETVTVNLRVKVAPEAGVELPRAQAEAEQALRSWFGGTCLGKDVLRAKLGDLLFRCGSVANYTIVAPAVDVSVAADVLPVLGTVTVEGMA